MSSPEFREELLPLLRRMLEEDRLKRITVQELMAHEVGRTRGKWLASDSLSSPNAMLMPYQPIIWPLIHRDLGPDW